MEFRLGRDRFYGRTEKNLDMPKDSRSLRREPNSKLSEYEAKLITIRPSSVVAGNSLSGEQPLGFQGLYSIQLL